MSKQRKIVGYWAKVELNYRQPEAERATEKLREILDQPTINAIFNITGFVQAGGLKDRKKLEELAAMAEEKKDALTQGHKNSS